MKDNCNPKMSCTGQSVILKFLYPRDVPEKAVQISVYKGVPKWFFRNDAKTLEDIPKVLADILVELQPNEDATYTLNEKGGYCYYVRGVEDDTYYNIIKLFVIREEDVAAGQKILTLSTGPIAGNGFEPCNNSPVGENGEKAPEGFNQGPMFLVPVEGSDEMEYLLGEKGLKGYTPFTTPAFREGRARHQSTTQNELVEFITKQAKKSPYMHVFSAGKTTELNYDIPLVVFTKKQIAADASLQETAGILKKGGLPIVWHQAQIHPYEPGSCEGALAMMQDLCGAWGKNILDKIDVVMIPRVNVEGAFLFWRGDYHGVDMNRDHMLVSSEQTAILHDAYYTFMPHVVYDGHELFYSEEGNYENDPDRFPLNDFQIFGATSLNIDPEVSSIAVKISERMHADLVERGMRACHFTATSNNPIGRAYYGLTNAIAVLNEGHGADGGQYAMPRRVYGQVIASKALYEYTADNAADIVAAVDGARKRVQKMGTSCCAENVLVLKQEASGKKTSPVPQERYVADIFGNIESVGRESAKLQDVILRSRIRPTAYLIDAEGFTESIKRILEHQHIEFFPLPKGVSVNVQQYYYLEKDGAKSCIADLRNPQERVFAHGAILIPMDQITGNVIGMLMEPDVGDSANNNGSLFQCGLVSYDAKTKNMPLYRYMGDNPRSLLS